MSDTMSEHLDTKKLEKVISYTEDIIHALQNIKDSSGNMIYDNMFPYLVFEISSNIYQGSTFEKEMEILKSKTFKSESDMVLSMGKMKEHRDKYDKFVELSRVKLDIGEGIYKCKKCESHSTTSFQKRVRSGDEPLVTVVTCNNCTAKWQMG